ncbi:hypothetical protein CN203_11475 [Sinorhizobium meliloti]|uniref:hypothetical protein n=1 Tax=Rhizobium meliloti TaxID=382 RepID=UPI0002FB5617|nr:hypothetical protein [Sinorhizobium meliloti]RVH78109.1 hypothetical protein CN203_11475 [Sinorhizobium meliloti]
MPLPKRIVLRSHRRRPGEPVEAASEPQAAIDLGQRSAIKSLAELCCKTVIIEGDDYVLREFDGKEYFRGSRIGAINSLDDIGYDLGIQDYVDMARDEFAVEDPQLSFENFLACGDR